MMKYNRLVDVIPLHLLTEDIITIAEELRSASRVEAKAVPEFSLYINLIEEGLNHRHLTSLFLKGIRVSGLNFRLGLENLKEYFEIVVHSAKEAFRSHIEKTRFRKLLEDLDLAYRVDVRLILGSIESPGLPRLEGGIERRDVQRLIRHILSSSAPGLDTVLFIFKGENIPIREHFKSLEELEEAKWDAMDSLYMTRRSISLSYKWMEKAGELLGYPKCDVFNYAQRKLIKYLSTLKRGYGISPEGETAREFLSSGLYNFLVENLFRKGRLSFGKLISLATRGLPREFYSNFLWRVYPCSIKCERAIKKGLEIDRLLESINERFAIAYRIRIISEQLEAIAREISAYRHANRVAGNIKRGLPEDIEERIRNIHSLLKTYNIKEIPGYMEATKMALKRYPMIPRGSPYILAAYLNFKGKDASILDKKDIYEIAELYRRTYRTSILERR